MSSEQIEIAAGLAGRGRWPARLAWIEGPDELRFGAALERSDRMVAALSALGLRAGERVAIATEREAEVAVLLFSCLRLGLVMVPLAAEASAHEARAILERAEPTLTILDAGLAERWGIAAGERTWLVVERSLGARLFGKSEPHTLDAHLRAARPDEGALGPFDGSRDLALIATSGSTGAPKLVRITVGNLVAQASTFARELGIGPGARVFNLSPLVHVDGLTGLFVALWSGSTLIRPGRFSVDRLAELLHALYRYRATHALVVPTFLQLALRLSEDLRAAFATGDLKLIISTAAPLSEALRHEFEARTSIRVVDMFGLTETGNVLFTRPSEVAHQGTLGRAVDCETRIVGPDGAVLADDAEGELEVRGPSVSPGYFGEAARESPWFATGDLVCRDSRGVFRLIGRKKNVIITGGRNVHAEEVDAALASHPDVLEALTIGVPDPIWGERVESAITPRRALTAPELDAVGRHAAERLSPFKRPRALHVLDALPRTASGKPSRTALRERLITLGAHGDTPADADLEATAIAIAATVLRVQATELSRASAPGKPRSWDSLAHLQLVERLEERYAIELTPGEITRIDSLGRLIDLVAHKRGRG